MWEWEGGEQYQRAREQVAPVVINPPPTPGITLGPQGTTLYPPSQGWEEPMWRPDFPGAAREAP